MRRARAGRLRKELTELVTTIEPDEHAQQLAESLLAEQEDFKKQLESWIERLEQAAATSNEKNTVVGTKIKGKNVHIGDKGASDYTHWNKKNTVEGSEIEADGDFHLGDVR